jgi:hypothetical protein
MSYGIIEYDDAGKPICEICGKSFSRVLSHVRQKHDMTEREYKIEFGFDLNKGICSLESSEKSRQKALENYDLVIAENLIANGSKTRFVKGSAGRTKDKLSEQTKNALRERLKQPYMQDILKKNGVKLGKTGLGNKKRWGNEQ